MATSAQNAFNKRQAQLKKAGAKRVAKAKADKKYTAQVVEFNTRSKQRGTATNPKPRTPAQNRVSSTRNKMKGQLPDDTGRQYQGPNGKMTFPKGMPASMRKQLTPRAYSQPLETEKRAMAKKPAVKKPAVKKPQITGKSDAQNAVLGIPRVKKRTNAINKLTRGIR